MSDELRPCPFCGGPANESTERVGNSTWLTFVKCWSCAFDMQLSKWNRRPIEDALRAEIAALKEVVRAGDDLRAMLGPEINVCICAMCTTMKRDAYDAARAKVTLE